MEQTLGKRISANRKRLGLTQEQLAEKLSVTAQAVSKWENDQSCPDISLLPKLAEVFSISTDALLGCMSPGQIVHEAQVVEDDAQEPEGLHIQNGSWDFHWDSGKRGTLRLAVLVIAVGILYLLAQLQHWDVSFWEILWPSALLIFGLFGVFEKFSFVSLGVALVGSFFLADNLIPTGLNFDGSLIFAVIIVLLGVGLLTDVLRKKKKPSCHFRYNGSGKNERMHSYETSEDSFDYSASFGADHQFVSIPLLRSGDISTSFGEYTVDLSGVEAVTDDCSIDISCSFGELTLFVPKKFRVRPDSSTAFAAFQIDDHPGGELAGTILLEVSASFGQVNVRYT